eukprot:m.3388 g.3388  ORF g.3388 m.3388 type:complete len:471 (+) comp2761_c0_seq1:327-1739(+)
MSSVSIISDMERSPKINNGDVPNTQKRYYAYLLLILSAGSVHFQRQSYQTMVPYIGNELNLTDYTEAGLISAFYYGYTPFMTLGGASAEILGAKSMFVFILGGSAGVLLLLPFALRYSVRMSWFLVFMLGAVQSAWVPTVTVYNSLWLAKGVETSKVTSWKNMLGRGGRLVSPMAVPILIQLVGWPVTSQIIGLHMGGMCFAWFMLGASNPRTCSFLPTEESRFLEANCTATDTVGEDEDVSAKTKSQKTFVGTLTKVINRLTAGIKVLVKNPVALSVISAQLSHNMTQAFLNISLNRLFEQKFNMGSIEAGTRVAFTGITSLLTPFIIVSIENWLIARVETVSIRRIGSGLAILISTTSVVILTAATTVFTTQLCIALIHIGLALHTMGYVRSISEVGAEYRGILAGLSNQVANCAGIVLPPTIVYLRSLADGSYKYTGIPMALCSIVAAVFYLPLVETESVNLKKKNE